jgi:hypothetical protein
VEVGGSFELEGPRYTVRANMWGSTYGMARDDATAVATAHHVGRKRWNVEAGEQTYGFQRASPWRADQELRSGGERVGSVRRTSMWRTDAVADLPGLPLPVQIFVLRPGGRPRRVERVQRVSRRHRRCGCVSHGAPAPWGVRRCPISTDSTPLGHRLVTPTRRNRPVAYRSPLRLP